MYLDDAGGRGIWLWLISVALREGRGDGTGDVACCARWKGKL